MKKQLVILLGLVPFLVQASLALTKSQCLDLRKEIELTYLSYLHSKNELESSEPLVSRTVIVQQLDRFLA
tara:strand:- start:149 stop:358 length:210 start_codon:yes stop_codon:yes gene_type:complete